MLRFAAYYPTWLWIDPKKARRGICAQRSWRCNPEREKIQQGLAKNKMVVH